MESYPSLSNPNAKLNYSSSVGGGDGVRGGGNGNGTSTTASGCNEKRMPLSRSLTQPQGTIEYLVTGTDTLASIAARFQTTPSELTRINKITGRFVFPGQVLFVPKRNQSNDKEKKNVDVPPNTPNDCRTSSGSESNLDSAVPGQAKRVMDNLPFASTENDLQHIQLYQTTSSPISTFAEPYTISPPFTTPAIPSSFATSKVQTNIDPADRECLERFLKINVRHITDGQGVVGGVLLITPNALMFDPNVSDPLVIEHGTELYGVTIPIELVFKTALYTDIAHMRVKHAPEVVPMVPKPAVYYASDEDAGCIVEENLRNVYAKKMAAQMDSDLIKEQPAEEADLSPQDDSQLVDIDNNESIDVCDNLEIDQSIDQEECPKSCDDDNDETAQQVKSNENNNCDELLIDLSDKPDDNDKASQDDDKENQSEDQDVTMSETDSFDQDQSNLNNSLDSLRFPKPHSPNTLSSHFQSKLALGERHSAPLMNNNKKENTPPLISAVSAEESGEVLVNKRRSASGESRREQMLKRLSNPVDTIGNLTKSGFNSSLNVTKSSFNATKSGISTGIHATKSGISTGIMATKTGLTTGLSVTKTGFNKVLSTPKNIMDFSSGLVRDAKGAIGTGSKSDTDLAEHLDNPEPMVGYTNMVDTKVSAFENFDKLIPKPASNNKDAPLYLCIRMGKFTKQYRKSKRFSPTYSFGKKKYEREYWFSVPKEKSKNLYHFFKKWAPEVYGDVDDINGCESRSLEPLGTDNENDDDDDEEEKIEIVGSADGDDSENKENDGQKLSANNKPRFWRRRSPLNFLKLVEDHFSTDGMSTDWNVSNSSEDHSFSERFMMESTEPILPDIIGQTELLTLEIIRNLSKHLPARAEGYAWTAIYSTMLNGFSLNTLYREMKRFDSPVLFIIEDTNGAKFGALLSTTLQISDHFYGTGETFLFTFYPEFACYPWTGENLFFIKGNVDSISIGAGEGCFGLWLDGDLYHGSSHPCKTFGNCTLSSEEDFVVKSIECWGFV